MSGMTKHAKPGSASLRRGLTAAWTVALSMAGTTMGYQVYHAIKFGHMPWPLAYAYGIVPLLISLCILEIVAEWRDAPRWAKVGAYAIMGGSMFLSAASTGEVVLRAAPPHFSLLFGFLMDGAALVAVHFILTAPAAAAARAAEEAERQAALERAEADERTALRAELRAVQEDLEAAQRAHADAQREAGLRAAAEAARNEALDAAEAAQDARQAAEIARAEAEQNAAQAEARAAQLARKLDRATGAQGTRKTAQNSGGSARAKTETEVPEDVDAGAAALALLEKEPGISGAQLGVRVGMSKRWGQDFRKALTQTAPQDVVPDSAPGGEL